MDRTPIKKLHSNWLLGAGELTRCNHKRWSRSTTWWPTLRTQKPPPRAKERRRTPRSRSPARWGSRSRGAPASERWRPIARCSRAERRSRTPATTGAPRPGPSPFCFPLSPLFGSLILLNMCKGMETNSQMHVEFSHWGRKSRGGPPLIFFSLHTIFPQHI